MHTGKELEAHWVEEGHLSCDIDEPQVGSARSDSIRVVQVNRRKTNRRKTRPYCKLYLTTVPVLHTPCRRVCGDPYSYLTLILEGGKQPSSRLGHFNLGKERVYIV